VIVVGRRTLFCAALITDTDRGRYHWPKSVAGSTVQQLPCVAGPASELGPTNNATAVARHRCVSPGRWAELDVSGCQYTDHVTRQLANVAAVSEPHCVIITVIIIVFQPVAIETLGPLNASALNFLSEVGRRLTSLSGDPRETSFLFQRLSILIQRFNSALITDSFCFANEDPDL